MTKALIENKEFDFSWDNTFHIAYLNGENIEIKPPAFLIGYWQTEKYFKEFRHCILNNFLLN